MRNPRFRYTFLFVGGTLLGAFSIERMAEGIAAGKFFVPPLLLLTTLVWFPALSLSSRIWVGGGVGFLVDSFADVSFGTMILLVLFLALLTSFLRSIFSDRDSLFAKSAIVACLVVSAIFCAPIMGQLIAYIRV